MARAPGQLGTSGRDDPGNSLSVKELPMAVTRCSAYPSSGYVYDLQNKFDASVAADKKASSVAFNVKGAPSRKHTPDGVADEFVIDFFGNKAEGGKLQVKLGDRSKLGPATECTATIPATDYNQRLEYSVKLAKGDTAEEVAKKVADAINSASTKQYPGSQNKMLQATAKVVAVPGKPDHKAVKVELSNWFMRQPR